MDLDKINNLITQLEWLSNRLLAMSQQIGHYATHLKEVRERQVTNRTQFFSLEEEEKYRTYHFGEWTNQLTKLSTFLNKD
jgi:ABC-type transporter Mla subunit MlaD